MRTAKENIGIGASALATATLMATTASPWTVGIAIHLLSLSLESIFFLPQVLQDPQFKAKQMRASESFYALRDAFTTLSDSFAEYGKENAWNFLSCGMNLGLGVGVLWRSGHTVVEIVREANWNRLLTWTGAKIAGGAVGGSLIFAQGLQMSGPDPIYGREPHPVRRDGGSSNSDIPQKGPHSQV